MKPTDMSPSGTHAQTRRSLLGLTAWAAIAVAAAGAATSASAQTYPSRPIRFIVPFGTSVLDAVARALSIHMAKAMGQPVVVENLPGAGGLTGTTQMVRAPKDGYTIGLINNSHVINPSIYKEMPYDSIKDVAPIGIIGHTPLILLVNPAVPAKDLRELIALAKAKPGALTYGSSGSGAILHLAGVLFASEAEVDIKHIPYKAAGQMFTDLVAGHIDMAFPAALTAAAQIQGGKLRPIGVTSQVRSRMLPDVPTLAEAGLPNYNLRGWLAMAGPAGLPKPVIDRLNAELKAALALPEMRETLAKLDVTIVDSTPESTSEFLKMELDEHTRLVKRSGATLQ